MAAPPEDGRANAAVVRLVADALALPADRVRIVAGQASRTKIVEIDGLEREAIDAAFSAAAVA